MNLFPIRFSILYIRYNPFISLYLTFPAYRRFLMPLQQTTFENIGALSNIASCHTVFDRIHLILYFHIQSRVFQIRLLQQLALNSPLLKTSILYIWVLRVQFLYYEQTNAYILNQQKFKWLVLHVYMHMHYDINIGIMNKQTRFGL